MLNTFVTIPLQIICQLVVSGNNKESLGNVPIVNTQLPETTTESLNYALKTPKATTTLSNDDVPIVPDGYIAFPDIKVGYKYYSNGLSWDSARKMCIENGSNLAEIDTFEKVKYAMMIKEWNRNLHVGIHRFFNKAEWTSLKTGLHVLTIPWASESYVEESDLKCVGMVADGRGLTANDCEYPLHFICEIPLSLQY